MLLKHRRTLHLLISMYHRSKQESYLDRRDIATRQFDKVKFKVINPNIKCAFKCPNYLGAKLWDKLPKETQIEPSINVFKFKVKKLIAAGMFD